MKSRWKTYMLYASLIILGGGLVFILVETVRAKNTGFETKTLWDWMELLIIPLVLAIGAFFLNRSERAVEREIATDRQQEAVLQDYLDKMSELLLEKKLRTTKNKEVREVAKAWTVTAMRGLDAKRNNIVLGFLREANLITGANSILKGSNMEFVNMQSANLVHANLEDADLMNANLLGAVLKDANLTNAGFEYANMELVFLVGAILRNASFEKAILKSAFLMKANMEDAFLLGANLAGADLSGANLQDAILDDANLKNANLENAQVTIEQLSTAKSLKGATMPDGTIHE